jgi:hypothetical protein
LEKEVKLPLFFKVQRMSGRRVAHVAKLRSVAELDAVAPYLKEAHAFARSEERGKTRRA